MFRKIKSLKSSSSQQLPYLKVGCEKYIGDAVKDGFYASIKKLKTKPDNNNTEEHGIDYLEDYKHILDFCQNKKDLPPICLQTSTKILKKMKANVHDFYSVTPAHFLNAGQEGIEHFNFLLNYVIEDVNNATVEELNSRYALLL